MNLTNRTGLMRSGRNVSMWAIFCLALVALTDSSVLVSAETEVDASLSTSSQLETNQKPFASRNYVKGLGRRILMETNSTGDDDDDDDDAMLVSNILTPSKGKGMPSKGKGVDPSRTMAPGKGGSGKGASMAPGDSGKGKGGSGKGASMAPGDSGKGKGGSKGKGASMAPGGKGTGKGSAAPGDSGKGKGGSMKKSSKSSLVPGATRSPSSMKTAKSSKSGGKRSGSPVAIGTSSPTISISPTMAPVAPTPTTPEPTQAPTNNVFPVVVLQIYDVLYTITQSRFLLPSEYEETANVTSDYLSNRFEEQFENEDLINLRSVETEKLDQDFSFGDPVIIVYETILTFQQNSLVPSEADLNALLEDFFVGPNEAVYIEFLVSQLPDTNLFDTTTEVGFRFVEESSEQSRAGLLGEAEELLTIVGAGIIAGLLGFGLVYYGMSTYDNRRQSKRQALTAAGLDGHSVHKDHQTVAGETTAATSVGDSTMWDLNTIATERTSKTSRSRSTKSKSRSSTIKWPRPSFLSRSPKDVPLNPTPEEEEEDEDRIIYVDSFEDEPPSQELEKEKKEESDSDDDSTEEEDTFEDTSSDDGSNDSSLVFS